MVEGREREEELERENVVMGARLTAAEMNRSEYSGSPTMRLETPMPTTPLPFGLPLPSDCNTPTPRRQHGSASTTDSAPRSGSPTLTFAANGASSAQQASSSDTNRTPATRRVADRDRHASKESLASSSSGLKGNGLGDLGSPLMGQTMNFGPKSSYGSTASPLKFRSAAPVVLAPPHRGQFSHLRLPSASPTSPNRLSKLSNASSGATDEDDSDMADQSFDSSVSVPPAGGRAKLRQRDEAFLADLTGEFTTPTSTAGWSTVEQEDGEEE